MVRDASEEASRGWIGADHMLKIFTVPYQQD